MVLGPGRSRAEYAADRAALKKENQARATKKEATTKPASSGDAMAISMGKLSDTLAATAKANAAAATAAAVVSAREATIGEVMAAAYQQQAELGLLGVAQAWYATWNGKPKGKRGLPIPKYAAALGFPPGQLEAEA